MTTNKKCRSGWTGRLRRRPKTEDDMILGSRRDADKYPQRSSHFAHKFVRTMLKTCLAQEIGAEAVLLLTFTAHTEDARRYAGPVTWWNHQIAPLIGVQERQLRRIREKCVDAGWLHYEPGAKGRAGRYWVVIPDWAASLDDLPSDEGATRSDLTPIATNPVADDRALSGNVSGNCPEMCPPFNPTSTSTPSPEKRARTSQFVAPTLDEVQAYCRERGSSFDPEAFFAHYEANGWRQGQGRGRPIQNWKACVTTWEKRQPEFQRANGSNTGRPYAGLVEFSQGPFSEVG